jgi:hypothetical protein
MLTPGPSLVTVVNAASIAGAAVRSAAMGTMTAIDSRGSGGLPLFAAVSRMTAAAAVTTASVSCHHDATTNDGLPAYLTSSRAATATAPSDARAAAAQRQRNTSATAASDHPAASTAPAGQSPPNSAGLARPGAPYACPRNGPDASCPTSDSA